MKRFLLTVLSGLFLAPSGFAILDTNHNGVSDLWEKAQNNGELFPGTLDSQADPDLDGWTNAQEAAAGTNPFDPNPPDGLIRPEVAHIPAVLGEPDENGVPTVITPEAVTVTWPTIVGKQYTLLFSPDLTEGSWIPVGDSFIGTGNEVTYGFEVSDSDKRFWRVSVGDVDTDSDGLSNHEEFLVGTNPTFLDSDGDTLSDSAELIAGTDPLQTDADGDGWMDSQEIAAGTDSRNQDSDGDGIPDPIDSQPLVGALAFPDADGDGIADLDDAAPNDPRGPAPTIISETAAGNPVSNLVKAETARFVLSVTNPSGPAPTASNLTFFLNGTEETASITAIGSPGASSQRFLLTWTSQTTTDYPTRTLQNLALRFRDAQMATTWLKLARIDVAEWEGYIAMAPVRHTETDGNNIDLEIESHINGRRYADFFGNSRGVCECYYRGPHSISVRNQASHAPIAAFQISEGAKSPLFITRFTAEGISNTSTIDAGNFTSYPHNSAWFFNHTASPLRYDWGNIVTEVGGNSTGLAEYGDSWGASEIAVDWLADPLRAICRSTWQHEWPFIATMDRQVHAAYPLNGSPWVTAYGLTLRSKLPASITPHLAGTVEVPGLPLHPLAIEKEGILFPVASETYHQILYKVDPAAGVWTAGIKLHLGRTSGQDTTPQTGIDLYDFTSGVPEPVSLDASGDLLLSPTQNTVLYQKLTSSGGLPLFLKRTSTADQPHTLEIRFVSKYEANKETTVAAVSLLPVEVEDGDCALTSLSRDEDPWTNANIQRQIPDSSIAWITGNTGAENTPEMPKIKAKIVGGPASMNVRWRFECECRRGNGYRQAYVSDFTRPEDRVGIPKRDGSEYTEELPASQEWKIYEHPKWIQELNENGFFGGLGKVFLKLKDQPEIEVCRFRIGGRNPDEAVAKAYINSKAGATYWYAYAVAKHETFGRVPGRFYNQFYTDHQPTGGRIGDTANDMGWVAWAKAWPLYNLDRSYSRSNGYRQNGPGGYGMFQLTFGPKTPGGDQSSEGFITRAQIWNWQENCNRAITELQGKMTNAINLENALEGGYPNWPQVDAATYGRLGGRDASVLTYYNGMFGGQIKSVSVGRRSVKTCWWPDQRGSGNNVQRSWSFLQNINDYVQHVNSHIE